MHCVDGIQHEVLWPGGGRVDQAEGARQLLRQAAAVRVLCGARAPAPLQVRRVLVDAAPGQRLRIILSRAPAQCAHVAATHACS